ncbi:MAG: hypothetical protein EZS26_004032 [Candidatus Ordinivivax streblomastigis]|uniref:RagB/SusD domain-containing protein n=1 Tax=Candidatus Ordinivivax streblomastigis TaxID=2540710 RepID=A0A5M8NRR1_9BACT|nr:MAG: hypothetical protein EZS26_004032 [Candidatus Ordinivivax streblomastigis]
MRERAQARPISETDVTIDYILDERARELYGEERRRQTLLRIGGDVYKNRMLAYGLNIADYPEYKNGEPWTGFLWPIPQSVINSNLDGVIEQNPGWDSEPEK